MGTRHLLTASPPRTHVTTAHRPPDDSERRPLSPWRDLRTAARHRHRVGPCGSCGRSLSPTAGRSHPSVPHTIPGFTEDNRVANQALVDLVRRVARRHNATPAQVALARPPGRRRRHPASRRRLRRGRRGGVYLLAVRHPGRPGGPGGDGWAGARRRSVAGRPRPGSVLAGACGAAAHRAGHHRSVSQRIERSPAALEAMCRRPSRRLPCPPPLEPSRT